MKKLFTLLVCALIVASLSQCKKGDKGETGAKGATGNANVVEKYQVSIGGVKIPVSKLYREALLQVIDKD